MAIPNFDPTGYGALTAPAPTPDAVTAAPATSARAALPGGGPTLVITNLGPSDAVVLLGDETVTVTSPGDGIVVLRRASIALAVGSNSYCSAIGTEDRAVLNLAQGT